MLVYRQPSIQVKNIFLLKIMNIFFIYRTLNAFVRNIKKTCFVEAHQRMYVIYRKNVYRWRRKLKPFYSII